MNADLQRSIRNAISKYWEAGEVICDARASNIAQAHGVSVGRVWREIRTASDPRTKGEQ